MRRYLIIIEKTDSGYSAYSPDLLGCVSTGQNRKDVESKMKEAIEFHLEGLKEEGYPVPEPLADSAYLEVAL